MSLPDIFPILPSLTLEQMLQVCQRYGISTHSRISRVILFSDIASAISERHPGLIRPTNPNVNLTLDRNLTPDLMVSELAREIGLNLRRVEQDLNFDEIWLASLGIRFLTKRDTISSAIVYYLYEQKIPIPREWWYQPGDPINSVYQMTQANFIQYFDTFSDDTPEEWLLTTSQTRPSLWVVLDLQPVEALSRVVQLFPGKPYFESRIGYIFHIGEVVEANPQLRLTLLQTLQQIWSNPTRAQLVRRQIPPVSLEQATPEIVLALPPNRLEVPFYTSGSTQALEQLLRVRTDHLAWKSLVVPNRQVSIDQLIQIISDNSKELRNLSDQVLTQLTSVDVSNDDWNRIRMKIDIALKTTFRVEVNPPCENMNGFDVMGNNIEPDHIYVTYGNLQHKTCYSFVALRTAFWDAEHQRMSYRQLDNPNLTYDPGDIRNLILELQKQKIGFYLLRRPYPPEAEDLLRFLKSDEHNLSNKISFSGVPTRDRQILTGIFTKLFEAGMYQRRWIGPAEPFPVTGQGSGQVCDIAPRMTVSLNDITDLYSSLTPQTRNLFDSLPAIGPNESTRSAKLINEILSVRAGTQCTALAQSDFIYSGDYYLRQLGTPIPEFDVKHFTSNTTHYAGNLPTAGDVEVLTQEQIDEAHAPPRLQEE
jgi:hypothetical protein